MNNNDEIYLNDVVMEEERTEEEYEIQPSLQIEENIDVDEGKKKMKENFKKDSSKEKMERMVKMHYVGHYCVNDK